MVSRAKSLSLIEVGSELEALLLEAKMINRFKPFYNLIAKDDKSPYYIHLSSDLYPKPVLNHDPAKAIAGPFINSLISKRILKLFRRVAPYCTAPKTQKNPCLYSHLGLCHPCPHTAGGLTVDQIANYRQNIRRLRQLLLGNFSQVRSNLQRSMTEFSQNQDYEKAQLVRDQLLALETLLARPVLPEDYLADPNLEIDRRLASQNALLELLSPYFPKLNNNLHTFRIEVYDIANLQGQQAAAAMTVSVGGYVDHRLYRHFKIKTVQGINDPAMLAEVISRRLKNAHWPMPDLIVLDGGIPQLSVVQKITPHLALISLAKKNEEIIIPVGADYQTLIVSKDNSGLRLLEQLRDEAHRFSRRLHHKYRSANMYI